MCLLNSKSQLHFLTTRKTAHFRGNTKCNYHSAFTSQIDIYWHGYHTIQWGLGQGWSQHTGNSRLPSQLALAICELGPHYPSVDDPAQQRENGGVAGPAACTSSRSKPKGLVYGAIPLLRFGGHVKAKVQQCARAQRWLHDVSSRLKQNKW